MGIDYVTTNVRLPKEMHRALKWRAVEENTSVAALIRESIARYLVEEQMAVVPPEDEPVSDPIFQLASCRRSNNGGHCWESGLMYTKDG